MRSLGLVATQTLTYLFADVEGSTAMWRVRRALAWHAWPSGERVRAWMGVHCGETAAGLGLHQLKTAGLPEQILRLQTEGLPAASPPLRPLEDRCC